MIDLIVTWLVFEYIRGNIMSFFDISSTTDHNIVGVSTNIGINNISRRDDYFDNLTTQPSTTYTVDDVTWGSGTTINVEDKGSITSEFKFSDLSVLDIFSVGGSVNLEKILDVGAITTACGLLVSGLPIDTSGDRSVFDGTKFHDKLSWYLRGSYNPGYSSVTNVEPYIRDDAYLDVFTQKYVEDGETIKNQLMLSLARVSTARDFINILRTYQLAPKTIGNAGAINFISIPDKDDLPTGATKILQPMKPKDQRASGSSEDALVVLSEVRGSNNVAGISPDTQILERAYGVNTNETKVLSRGSTGSPIRISNTQFPYATDKWVAMAEIVLQREYMRQMQNSIELTVSARPAMVTTNSDKYKVTATKAVQDVYKNIQLFNVIRYRDRWYRIMDIRTNYKAKNPTITIFLIYLDDVEDE